MDLLKNSSAYLKKKIENIITNTATIVQNTAVPHIDVGTQWYQPLQFNVGTKTEDILVIMHTPIGGRIPSRIQDLGAGNFRGWFCPKMARYHRLFVYFRKKLIGSRTFIVIKAKTTVEDKSDDAPISDEIAKEIKTY